MAKQPTIYLSNQDQKRKPSKEEVQFYFSVDGHYTEFTMCPGDVLYIPPGFIHNASTVDFEKLDGPWDGCHIHPTDETAISRIGGPSLHLTFGLEQSCTGTVEALLHHALHVYFSDANHSDMQIVPRCNASWKSIVHYSLADIARRKHDCDNPSCGGVHYFGNCDGSAVLRRSVPLLSHENAENNADDMKHFANLNVTYQKALGSFLALKDMPRALKFAQSHFGQSSEPGLAFCFPEISADHIITCADDLIASSEKLQDEYLQVVQNFVSYATMNFESALQHMNMHRNQLRKESREEQNTLLEMVGQ